VAPTRERPGILRVRISDREVWHVVDPALTDAEAEEAVGAHRAANAPTNRSVVRRVLAWTPGVVALLLLGGAVVGMVVVMDELDLVELVAQVAVAVVLSGIGFVVAATVGIVLLEAPWRRDRVEPQPVTSGSVVPVEAAALRWIGDETPVTDAWRVVRAIALLNELEAARWRLADVLYGRLDDDSDSDGDDDDLAGRHPAAVALRAARAQASAELRSLGDEVGFDVAGAIRSGALGW
jgi:hypothetical protein